MVDGGASCRLPGRPGPGLDARPRRERPAGLSTSATGCGSSRRGCTGRSTTSTRTRRAGPGAIYTIGLNYAAPTTPRRPARPLVYAKLPTSVSGPRRRGLVGPVADGERRPRGASSAWSSARRPWPCGRRMPCSTSSATRSSTTSRRGTRGWTATSGCSASRCPASAPWGRGSSRPTRSTGAGYAGSAAPSTARRSRTTRTGQMRYSIADVIAYLSRHTVLRPGDLIATGTPAGSPGPDAERHLQPGDVVTCLDRGHRGADHDHRLSTGSTRGGERIAMKPPTVFLGEMTTPRGGGVPARTTSTVIVPIGSTEQHGPHAPLLTDVLIPHEVARRVAPRVGAVVAPLGQLRACRIRTSASPASSTSGSRPSWRWSRTSAPRSPRSGSRRIVFLNGHYDNTYAIAYACANAADRLPAGVRAFPVNYWDGMTPEEAAEFFDPSNGLHANRGGDVGRPGDQPGAGRHGARERRDAAVPARSPTRAPCTRRSSSRRPARSTARPARARGAMRARATGRVRRALPDGGGRIDRPLLDDIERTFAAMPPR